MGDEFLLGEIERIEESAHRRLAVAPAPLMLSFIVVLLEPRIKVRLQGRDRVVDLLAEDDAIELVEHGLVQPFDDPVGLRRLGLCSGVVDVLQGQIQLVFVMLGVAAVFGAAVCQHA